MLFAQDDCLAMLPSIGFPHHSFYAYLCVNIRLFTLLTLRSLLSSLLLFSWDWRACMEDEMMYMDVETGELIHPIHYDNSEQSQE